MPIPGYDSFEQCLKENASKRNPGGYCKSIEQAASGKGNKAKANVMYGGINLHPMESTEGLDPTILGGATQSELMAFEGAILARAERNRNGDELSTQDIIALAHSIKYMPLTYEHKARDIRGFITQGYTDLDTDGNELGNTLFIDGIVFAGRFPETAAEIQSGERKTSVEADAEKAICSICDGIYAKQEEYCEHITSAQSRVNLNASRRFQGITAKGAGAVRNPAGTKATFNTNRLVMVASDSGVEIAQQANPDDVHLRSATDDETRCGTCEYFNEFQKSCQLVQGFISPGELCDLYEPGGPYMASLAEIESKLDQFIKANEDDKKKDDEKDKEWKDMKAAIEQLLKSGHIGDGLPGNGKPQEIDLPVATEPPLGEKKTPGSSVGVPDGFTAAQVQAGLGRIAKLVAYVGPDLATEYAADITAYTDRQFEFLAKALTAKVEAVRPTNGLSAALTGASSKSTNGGGFYQPYNGGKGAK